MLRTWARGSIGTAQLCALGLLLSAPVGARAQECSEDADCAEGFECELEASGGASVPDCPPGSECEPAPPPEPEPPRGECEPAEVVCTTDSDCPRGAVCVLRRADCDSASTDSGSDSGSAGDSEGEQAAPTPGSGSGSGGSGGAQPQADRALPQPAPECEAETEGQCVYTLVECDANSDCEGGDVCTAFNGGGSCSSDAPRCAGDGCPDPDPEPVCEETTISWCFPKPVDCSDGQTCGADTRCVELPEDVNDDAPASWNGATALCLPELWALAFEERIEIEGGRSSSDAASDGKATRGDALGESDDDAAEDGADSAAADDGCAVSAAGGDGAGGSWLPLLAAATVMLALRRRARRSSRS